jgi:hypothetical protein
MLAPGASCTVMVSFDPQVIGSRPSNLIIYENAYGGQVTIPLQGTGISGTQGALVAITPLTPCTQPLQTLQFTARVTNLTNTGVNWFVNNIAGGQFHLRHHIDDRALCRSCDSRNLLHRGSQPTGTVADEFRNGDR